MKTIIFIPILFLFGCATAGKMNKVSLGMTKPEVIDALGSPTSTSAINGVEYMNYALYETNENAKWGRSTPYFVRIINGKVDSYGRQGDFDSTKTPVSKIQIEQKITHTKDE